MLDYIGDRDPHLRGKRMGAFMRSAYALDRKLSLEEGRAVALIPEQEWLRLAETVTKLRDEMEASGKYRLSEILQVQAAVAIISDPSTRHELRAQAVDRVWRMFERENPPDSADQSEDKDAEQKLSEASTLDLMKRIRGA